MALPPVSPAPPAPAPARPEPAQERAPRPAGLTDLVRGTASLWEALTPEERELQAALGITGALTYGPGGQPVGPPPAPAGRRLDVRG